MTLFPGVRVNFSRRGISTTFGIPGASVNIGSKGVYLNTGIPGTGLYNRTRLDGKPSTSEDKNAEGKTGQNAAPIYFMPEELGAIRSKDNNSIMSEGLKGVKDTLLNAFNQRTFLQNEINFGQAALIKAERIFKIVNFFSIGGRIFAKSLERRRQDFNQCTADLAEAQHQFTECKVYIEIQFDSALSPLYDSLRSSFATLRTSQFCWDVTASFQVDRVKERSYAGTAISRKPVSIKESSLDFVHSEHPAFQFRNANGSDLYMFPAFLLAFRTKTDFALIDYRDLTIEYRNVNFVEDEPVPKDASVIGSTWKYVNKNGSRDLRFSNNFQIPIVLYGSIHFSSKQGLNEAYQFSNATAANSFANSIHKYQQAVSGNPQPSSEQRTYDRKAPPKMSKKQALNLLGLNGNPTQDQIRNAYYEIIQKYHPDKVSNLGEEIKKVAEEKTKEINEAYQVLQINP